MFEFADDIYRNGKWVFPFSSAQEIIETLRSQWGYLFHDALSILGQTREIALSPSVLALRGQPLQLALTRPPGWKDHLLSLLLMHEIADRKALRQDLEYGISLGDVEGGDNEDTIKVLRRDFNQMMGQIKTLDTLFNQVLQDALTEDDAASCAGRIVYVADRIGLTYQALIEWALRIQRMWVTEEASDLKTLVAKSPLQILDDINVFVAEFHKTVLEVWKDPRSIDGPHSVTLTLSLPEGLINDITSELERFAHL